MSVSLCIAIFRSKYTVTYDGMGFTFLTIGYPLQIRDLVLAKVVILFVSIWASFLDVSLACVSSSIENEYRIECGSRYTTWETNPTIESQKADFA